MSKYYAIIFDHAAGADVPDDVKIDTFAKTRRVLGVYLSENKVKREFKKIVEDFAKPYYYDEELDVIYEDSDTVFNAGGVDGFYWRYHIYVSVQEVSDDWRRFLKSLKRKETQK